MVKHNDIDLTPQKTNPQADCGVSYPVSVLMKVIMENIKKPEENRDKLVDLLKRLTLVADGWSHKFSPGEKYVSFSFNVMIPEREFLYKMHEELKKEPGVKFVI